MPPPNKTINYHPTIAASVSEEFVSAWLMFFGWFLPPLSFWIGSLEKLIFKLAGFLTNIQERNQANLDTSLHSYRITHLCTQDNTFPVHKLGLTTLYAANSIGSVIHCQ